MRVGVFVLVTLSIILVHGLLGPVGARNLNELVLFYLLFCWCVAALWFSGKEELGVRQFGVGIRLCEHSYARVSCGFRSVGSTPFWRC